MLESRICEVWPYVRWRGVPLVVACSGGADSTALLRGLVAITGNTPDELSAMVVAHFNHRWRGAESDGDEAFVQQLAAALGLACHVGRTGSSSESDRARDEATARDRRHGFLLEVARQTGARHIVLAHTADDQAETVLHRILRGTAIAGLTGMARVRPVTPDVSLVRPLLGVRRSEILDYLQSIGQSYREDSSNLDQAYTRNRIRHELLPRLQRDYNPQVVDALLNLAAAAGDMVSDTRDRVAVVAPRCIVRRDPTMVVLDRDALRALPVLLRIEIAKWVWQEQKWPLRSMGQEQWRAFDEVVLATADNLMLPGAVEVSATENRLTLSLRSKID